MRDIFKSIVYQPKHKNKLLFSRSLPYAKMPFRLFGYFMKHLLLQTQPLLVHLNGDTLLIQHPEF